MRFDFWTEDSVCFSDFERGLGRVGESQDFEALKKRAETSTCVYLVPHGTLVHGIIFLLLPSHASTCCDVETWY